MKKIIIKLIYEKLLFFISKLLFLILSVDQYYIKHNTILFLLDWYNFCLNRIICNKSANFLTTPLTEKSFVWYDPILYSKFQTE